MLLINKFNIGELSKFIKGPSLVAHFDVSNSMELISVILKSKSNLEIKKFTKKGEIYYLNNIEKIIGKNIIWNLYINYYNKQDYIILYTLLHMELYNGIMQQRQQIHILLFNSQRKANN